MTAKHCSEKNWNCTIFERALVTGSSPGKPGQVRFGKSAAAWGVSLAKLIVLAFLCAASVHAAAPRYQVIDLGSLGSPTFSAWFSGVACRLLNNKGTVVGGMGTAVPDPFCFNGDCLTQHAFEWTHGSLLDLGLLKRTMRVISARPPG
jgi:hypothetical protein